MRRRWGWVPIALLAAATAGCGAPTVRAVAAPAPSGAGDSLPTVSTGPRPGPPVLYEALAQPPELSVQAPFAAEPLMVSGTDAHCLGEYVYQDYLFDDHGANTQASPANGGEFGIFPPAGDVKYPTNDARYARNAADIVEVRMHAGAAATVFRITLNTVVATDAPAIGIGIDTDRADAVPVAWPGGAGISSRGLDAFITAWGSGGELSTRAPNDDALGPGTALPAAAVALDPTTNQLTIRVPRSMLPTSGTWRLVAGAGLWDGVDGFLPVVTGSNPTSTAPVSGSGSPAPAIFNLAFRFAEEQGGNSGGNTFIGRGNWFDETQSAALRDRTSGTAYADVTFSELAADGCRPIHGPSRDQARIVASHLDVPEGVHSEEPFFGGHLQPYMLHLPPPSPERPGLTLALHGNTATYTQWHVVSPRYLQQMGDERNHVVLSPLGRSTSGSGIEHDWFEAWADAAHHVQIDPSRTTISGYSAGGYNTFVVSTQFPDLFGSAFPIVGAGRLLDGGVPGNHTNFNAHMGNLRWVPVVAWNQAVDELAPYIGIRVTMDRLNELGLRNNLYTFPAGEHFTPGLLDQWTGGATYVGDGTVTRDPYRVDHTIAPETWAMLAPALGSDARFPEAHLVADHAYWVSGLRTRADVRDVTGTVRGSISAISRAFGLADPPSSRVASVYPGPPAPATVDGTEWGPIPSAEPRNALEVHLTNLATATIAGARAKLDGGRPLTVEITSDGDGELRLDLPLPPGTTVTPQPGSAPEAQAGRASATVGRSASASVDAQGADLPAVEGTVTYTLVPPEVDGADEPSSTPSATSALPATGGQPPVPLALALALGLMALALLGYRGRRAVN